MRKFYLVFTLLLFMLSIKAQVFQLSPRFSYGIMYSSQDFNSLSVQNASLGIAYDMNVSSQVKTSTKTSLYGLDLSYNIKRSTFTFGLAYLSQVDSVYSPYTSDWIPANEVSVMGRASYQGTAVRLIYDLRFPLSKKVSSNSYLSFFAGLESYIISGLKDSVICYADDVEADGLDYYEVTNTGFEDFFRNQYDGMHHHAVAGLSISMKNIGLSAQAMYLLNNSAYASDKLGWNISLKYDLLFYKKFKLDIYED